MPECATPLEEPQSAAAVLMVRPARFAFNPQTAASNAFQQNPQEGTPSGRPSGTRGLHDLALREFDAMADGLRREGVRVIVADDTEVPAKPDAVFPNNWVSFHRDGTLVLFPMLAPNRRTERREDVIRQVIKEGGFRITRTVDLSAHENDGKYLEGTGSLVLDRVHRVAYANLSPRTDLDVLGDFAQQLDYDLITFEAFDSKGDAVYHTNVLMAIGSGFAVVCGAAIAEPQHREAVFSKLSSTGHEIVDVTLAQMHEFTGNLLELAPPGRNVVALSTSAWRSLDPNQRRVLEKYGSILAADIPIIERYGGGGVRCMLAEIHLPTRI
jgi:hypothetical protein